MSYTIRILEQPHELAQVEALQQEIWGGSAVDIVPTHMLMAATHNGGLVLGAFWRPEGEAETLVGFVFGFPGFYHTPDGPRLKHCSHMLGVHPAHRNRGLGYRLKRAQWQMVRHQGIDRITWTYDPLLSANAQLNIAKLGGVCNTYHINFYGEMRDDLNLGLPSDRFEVDWWVNSRRVNSRLSKHARPQLRLDQFLAAEAILLNPTYERRGWRCPPQAPRAVPTQQEALLLVEIPANFAAMRQSAPDLALEWRLHSRALFQQAFEAGYLVTDFVRDPPAAPDQASTRCFYVLSHGESTL